VVRKDKEVEEPGKPHEMKGNLMRGAGVVAGWAGWSLLLEGKKVWTEGGVLPVCWKVS